MFENHRRGRQARNFTANVPKIVDLKSSSEQIFSENCRWVPLIYENHDGYYLNRVCILETGNPWIAVVERKIGNELWRSKGLERRSVDWGSRMSNATIEIIDFGGDNQRELSLRSKRFRASSSRKVGTRAKKKKKNRKWRGRGRGKKVSSSPLPLPPLFLLPL